MWKHPKPLLDASQSSVPLADMDRALNLPQGTAQGPRNFSAVGPRSREFLMNHRGVSPTRCRAGPGWSPTTGKRKPKSGWIGFLSTKIQRGKPKKPQKKARIFDPYLVQPGEASWPAWLRWVAEIILPLDPGEGVRSTAGSCWPKKNGAGWLDPHSRGVGWGTA